MQRQQIFVVLYYDDRLSLIVVNKNIFYDF